MFFFIRRLGPSIYCLPPKYISQTPKNICNFGLPKIISPSCTLTLRKPLKSLKCIEMTSKTSPIFVIIYPQNLHTPKNNDISETPTKYWNSRFWTPKNGPSLRIYMKISAPPPSPPPPTHTHSWGIRVWKADATKNKIKKVAPITIKV